MASELEARWNLALCRVRELESRLDQAQAESIARPVVEQAELLRLAEDLPAVWNSPVADLGLKQRIIRILLQEIAENVDEESQEIVLALHWVGGRHSELRVPKLKSGRHGRCTRQEAVDIVQQMAASYSDEEIAFTLNRLRLKTGVGNTWNDSRVRSLRWHLKLPSQQAGEKEGFINLKEAATSLGVSASVVRRLMEKNILSARQIVPGAPWQIADRDVNSPDVIRAAIALKNRESRKKQQIRDKSTPQMGRLFEEEL